MVPRMTFHRTVVLLGGIALAEFVCAQGAKNAADMKEIRDYRLSMDNIQKYLNAFKILNADAAAKKCGDTSNNSAKTLDDSEKALKTCSAAVADLAQAGVKPREFVVMTGALMGDFSLVSMKKAGQIKDYPPSISPENAAFLEQNFDKLQAMMSSMAK